MKRSSMVVVALLTALAILSIVVYRKRANAGPANDAERQFAYRDTAAVTKVFIADKEGHRSTIERTPKGWMVNGRYRARSEAVLNLLEVIRNVEVKMPVPKSARENVIRFMSSGAIMVEIYAGTEMVRKYYVGHETPDSEASYMLLYDIGNGRNFSDPFACFIPGFIGYLQPRFIARETEWRDRLVVNYTPPEMRKVTVSYPLHPDSSFSILLESTTAFRLTDAKGTQLDYEMPRLKQYLIYLQNLSYEGLVTGQNLRLQDSLSRSTPFAQLEVTTNSMRKDIYTMYRKSPVPGVAPELGVKFDYDPDRFYLRFDNGREWAVAQYYVFGKLLVTPAYFGAVPVKK